MRPSSRCTLMPQRQAHMEHVVHFTSPEFRGNPRGAEAPARSARLGVWRDRPKLAGSHRAVIGRIPEAEGASKHPYRARSAASTGFVEARPFELPDSFRIPDIIYRRTNRPGGMDRTPSAI